MTRTCKACSADINERPRNSVMCDPCRRARQHDPLAYAAHKAVADARRRGELAAPSSQPCADCGGAATDYDHREYAKPLRVDAVCRGCNLRRGSAIDALARNTSRITPRAPTDHQEAA